MRSIVRKPVLISLGSLAVRPLVSTQAFNLKDTAKHEYVSKHLCINPINLFSTSKQSSKKQKHQFDQKSSYFQILGVKPDASDEQIKSAYLQMVKKYHPDLSKQENASEKFQLIQKAYEVLSDPEQRSKHRSELKIPNPQTYQAAQQIREKYKNFKRKQHVPDEWQFSYKLFKKHYEQVDAKQKQYTKFPGQGDEYWVHKDQMKADRKVYIQQVAMIVGSIGIGSAALFYMWS